MVKRHKILVVDDEEYIVNIIDESLSAEKYDIISFQDPAAALEYIEKNSVDLVLTDLMMGDYSGVNILETTQKHHDDAIIILMTGYPTVQSAISILKKGAYDFLVKPFKLEQLKAAIRRGLQHQQIRRDNIMLKGQVEFLKVVNDTEADANIDEFLAQVASYCREEFSAEVVGIIQVDSDTGRPIRRIIDNRKSSYGEDVLSEATLEKFRYTRSSKPYVYSETITEEDESTANRTLICQPIFVRQTLHAVMNMVLVHRFKKITHGQLDLLAILASSVGSALANHNLYGDLESSYLQAIRGLANAIEARDPYTAGHTDRVCKLAEALALHLGWEGSKIRNLVMGCTLHDIGKIGVPDSILNKPERLTDEERNLMETHPKVGLKIVSGVDLFKPAIPFIMAHHESFDGTGYPRGLKGEEIPVEGRLLAVADTFDAILSNRPYRKGASLEVAVSELTKHAGTQFDPELVKAFIDVLRLKKIDLREMYGREENLDILNDESYAKKVLA